MELEEMKNAWLALNEKLEAKEKLSDRLIKEMYQTKVKKSISRLLGYEYFGVVICLFVFPLIAWKLSQMSGLFIRIVLIYWAVYVVALFVWQIVKIRCLGKIEILNSIKDNLFLISNYQKMISKEKLYSSLLAAIGVVLIMSLFLEISSLWKWAFLISLLLFVTLASIWQYKRFYAGNIRSIQRNLNDLKDMEE